MIEIYYRVNLIYLCYYYIHSMFVYIFRDHDSYLEFCYPVKMPVRLLSDSDPEVCKYKYHVESSATEKGLIKSVELIVAPSIRIGGVIDRFLTVKWVDSQLKTGGK